MPTKKIEEAEEVTRCPECNSGHLSFDYERGELICEECGLVLTDQMIDQGPEWRAVGRQPGGQGAPPRARAADTAAAKALSPTRGRTKEGCLGQTDPPPEPAPPPR